MWSCFGIKISRRISMDYLMGLVVLNVAYNERLGVFESIASSFHTRWRISKWSLYYYFSLSQLNCKIFSSALCLEVTVWHCWFCACRNFKDHFVIREQKKFLSLVLYYSQPVTLYDSLICDISRRSCFIMLIFWQTDRHIRWTTA